MNYNRAIIMVLCGKTAQHKTPLNYIIESTFNAGDEVMCETASGWREGRISTIQRINVKHGEYNKKVVLRSNYNQEDKKMTTELFRVVEIEHELGYKNFCKTSAEDAKIGDVVVYAINKSSTSKFHVGTIMHIYEKGEAHPATSESSWVVCKVHIDLMDRDIALEKEYTKVRRQLATRKKEFEEFAIYQMLAEKDPEARELLDKLQMLKGGPTL